MRMRRGAVRTCAAGLRVAGLCVAGMVWTTGAALANGGEDTCGAAALQGLVGQTGEIATLLVLDRPIRVITPGMPVTRDYRLDRINFDLDDAGGIVRIWCG